MHHLSFPSFIATGDLPLIAVLGVVGAFAVPLAAIIGTFIYRHKRERLWHETARVALEKNQPLPPRPLSDEELAFGAQPPGATTPGWDRRQWEFKRAKDIRTGVILLAVGAGLFFGLRHGPNVPARDLGAFVVAGVGAAMLVNAFLVPAPKSGDDFRDGRPRS